MRVTLTIDDDVLAYARTKAQQEQISLGKQISNLARAGIQAQSTPVFTPSQTLNRIALLPARQEVITTEHVRKLMDQAGM